MVASQSLTINRYLTFAVSLRGASSTITTKMKMVARSTGIFSRITLPNGNSQLEMNGRKLVLDLGDSQVSLFVVLPVGLSGVDDYREVNFELPGKGRHRAMFFLLPDRNSDDPNAVKPVSKWNVPVQWDDPTMLYIPTLGDDSILTAMKHIFDNGLEGEAFENEDDIGSSGG